MHRVLVGFGCSAVLLLNASPAFARSPPTGRYDCTIGANSILFGTLTIKSTTRYTHRGSAGTYATGARQVTFPDRIKGWTLRFKGGGLAGFKGRWYKGTDGTPAGNYEIALKNPRDGFESIYCDRRKT